MNRTIRVVLPASAELGVLIFQGSEVGGFVEPRRCLFLADQLTALTRELRDRFRAEQLLEARSLQDLDTDATSQAAGLAAFSDIVDIAVGTAEEALEAITKNNFQRARRRVSKGTYLLWHVDAALAELLIVSESTFLVHPSTSSAFIPEPEEQR